MSDEISTVETNAHHAHAESAQRTSRRSPGRPRIWQRAGLIALGILLGTAAAELTARAIGFEFRPHMRNRVYFAEPDLLLGWRNRASVSGPYGGDEFLTWVSQTPAGLRGRDYPEQRQGGTMRIAFLGDSQTWGDGVADAETFAARIDQRESGAGQVEALNFGTPGYGTDQELLHLDARVAAYAPDVVLVGLYVGNDLQDNTSPGTFQYPKPYFTLDTRGELLLQGVPVQSPEILHRGIEVYRLAMRHSAALNALAEATANEPPAFVPLSGLPETPPVYKSVYESEPSPADLRALRMTTRLLGAIAERAREMGARPVVLILPELWQVDVASHPGWRAALRARGVDWRRPQRVVRRALEQSGVDVVDVLQPLSRASRRARSSEEHVFYRGWRHLNAKGHAMVARVLASRLGLRPGDRPSKASWLGYPSSRIERSTGSRGRRSTWSARAMSEAS